MSLQSLWPEDLAPAADLNTPLAIPRVQAKALAPLTKHKVEAEVETGSHGQLVTPNFILLAPSLKNYRYRLSKVRHGIHPDYSAKIVVDSNNILKAATHDQLKEHLKNIYGSEATRGVIGELMAYADDTNSSISGSS